MFSGEWLSHLCICTDIIALVCVLHNQSIQTQSVTCDLVSGDNQSTNMLMPLWCCPNCVGLSILDTSPCIHNCSYPYAYKPPGRLTIQPSCSFVYPSRAVGYVHRRLKPCTIWHGTNVVSWASRWCWNRLNFYSSVASPVFNPSDCQIFGIRNRTWLVKKILDAHDACDACSASVILWTRL